MIRINRINVVHASRRRPTPTGSEETPMKSKSHRAWASTLVITALVLAACGDDDDTSSDATAAVGTSPVTGAASTSPATAAETTVPEAPADLTEFVAPITG